ncbi:MAG: VWA domain-containing protein [Burkholderiaceae bacterium]|nr:VWA domain-containing protein [Burkholderiaceae bacterium]
MRFQWPMMLWLLAAIPVFAFGYAALVARRRRQASRFANLTFVMDAARAGAKRRIPGALHLPIALFALGLIAAILAVARPTASITLPSMQQTLVLAMDVSLSMRARDVKPDRITAAKEAAKAFVSDLPPELKVAIVTFAGTAQMVQAPTRNREDLIATIDRFELQRHTATGSAILVSLATLFPDHGIDIEAATLGPSWRSQAFSDSPKREPKQIAKPFDAVQPGSNTSAAIVLLSDGRRTTGPNPLEVAKMAAQRGVKVYTVGFGTVEGAEVDVGGWSMFLRLDEVALKAVAELTHGEYFHAGTEEDLRKVYQGLTSKLVLEKADVEISFMFLAAAVALLLLSAGWSVAWTGRVA